MFLTVEQEGQEDLRVKFSGDYDSPLSELLELVIDVLPLDDSKTWLLVIAAKEYGPDDMDVNVNKEKKLTNMRTTSSDENIKLEPPRQITLELALEFIQNDELIEVTPDAVRLRKRVLDPTARKKAAKAAIHLD